MEKINFAEGLTTAYCLKLITDFIRDRIWENQPVDDMILLFCHPFTLSDDATVLEVNLMLRPRVYELFIHQHCPVFPNTVAYMA